MTFEKIKAIVRATPFRALEVRLRSGEVLPVRHPEGIAVSDPDCVVFLPDTLAIFDVDEVVSVRRARGKSRDGQGNARKNS